jgi:hypothetical protein
MRANRWIKLFVLGLLITIFCMPPEIILAQDKADRSGFLFGGWAGYGQMNVSTDNDSSNSHGTFALSFRGGYAVMSNVVIGLELNGWTIEAYNLEDPSKGESVSNVSLFFNYFPFKDLPLYITGGGGQLSFTNNNPEVDGRDNGGSWFVGSGYEIPLSKNLNFVPQIRYCQGDFTGGSFDVYELAVGINWYSGK